MPSPQRRGLRRSVDLPEEVAVVYLSASTTERTDAHRIVRGINAAATQLFALYAEAQAKRIDRILGYPTWDAFVAAELKITKQQKSQFKQAAELIMAMREVSGVPVQMTERRARALRPVLPEVLDAMRSLIDAGHDPHRVVEGVIEHYGRPNRKQAEAMALVPGAAAAMSLQLHETGAGRDEPGPAVEEQLEALNHLVRMTRAERPVEVLSQLMPADRQRLLAVIGEAEVMLADLRRLAAED